MSDRLEGTALDARRNDVNFQQADDMTRPSCHNCTKKYSCNFRGHRGCICNLWEADKWLIEEYVKMMCDNVIIVSRAKLQLEIKELNQSKGFYRHIQTDILERILKGDFA